MMYFYRLFGDVLRSDVEFPELETCPSAPPRWVLRRREDPPPTPDGVLLGEDVVTGEVRVRMYSQENGLRLRFDDTGCFDIGEEARDIIWYKAAGALLSDARADLTGRVIAAALHAAGTLSIHASGVVLGGNAVGFLGPKGRGKSTLSLALVSSGARLLTDDTFPVHLADPPMALPGLHAARLWSDSAAHVGIGRVAPSAAGEKLLFSQLPAERITHQPAPLAALYLLAPVRQLEDGSAASRTPLSPVQGALALVGHAKLAPLLRAHAAHLLRAAGELTSRVPVFRLDVVRDLGRLDDVVATIRDWHREPESVRFTASGLPSFEA